MWSRKDAREYVSHIDILYLGLQLINLLSKFVVKICGGMYSGVMKPNLIQGRATTVNVYSYL